VLLGCLPALPAEVAQPEPQPLPNVTHTFQESSSTTLLLGLRYDVGDASTYGLALYHAWETLDAHDGVGVRFWHGPGISFDLVTKSHDALDAFVISLPYHLDLMGDTVGFALEARVGVAPGDGQLLASGGVFFGFYFLDVGYTYQFPLAPTERPDWMASHQLGVRLEIPLRRWHVRDRSGATASAHLPPSASR
jgi:hypothetical protein